MVSLLHNAGHQVEPDPAEMAARYGAEPTVLIWRERLVCSRCGSRQVDMVVTGTEREPLNACALRRGGGSSITGGSSGRGIGIGCGGSS